jgi:hypothetical protein
MLAPCWPKPTSPVCNHRTSWGTGAPHTRAAGQVLDDRDAVCQSNPSYGNAEGRWRPREPRLSPIGGGPRSCFASLEHVSSQCMWADPGASGGPGPGSASRRRGTMPHPVRSVARTPPPHDGTDHASAEASRHGSDHLPRPSELRTNEGLRPTAHMALHAVDPGMWRVLAYRGLSGHESVNLQKAVEDCERRLIEWALTESAGNQVQATAMLNVPRATLRGRLGALGQNAVNDPTVGEESWPDPKKNARSCSEPGNVPEIAESVS